MIKVGVVADTHGMFREDLLSALKGVDQILIAGDIGNIEVYDSLREIAPVTAVWGNMDPSSVREIFREQLAFSINGVEVAMQHIPLCSPRQAPALVCKVRDGFGEDIRLFVFGHTHQPMNEEVDGMVLFNPGSAGPRRAGASPSVGIVEIDGDEIRARIVNLH